VRPNNKGLAALADQITYIDAADPLLVRFFDTQKAKRQPNKKKKI
jgi:hypothetical protein